MPQDLLNRANELTIGSSIPVNPPATAPVAPVLPTPTPTSPVVMLSSQAGQNIAQQNEQKIGQLEQYIVKPGDTLGQIAQQKGVNASDISGYQSGDPNLIRPGEVLTFKGGSPATVQISNQINQAATQGILPPTSPELQNLQQQESEILGAVTKARQAIDQGDVIGVDAYRKQAEDARARYETGLVELSKKLPELRAQRAQLAIPGEREKIIRQQLNALRSAADQFNLGVQRDKLAEYQGQVGSFAAGRASEIDFKASFARQEMALKEKNLLSELGLLQEARGMELKNVQQQLDDFATDFELRQKVDDKISALEENVLDKASTLTREDQKLLGDFVDNLQGKDWNDIGPGAQTGIINLAQTLNKPYLVDMVKEVLAASKSRYIFDNSLKLAQEQRLVGGVSTTTEPTNMIAYAQQYASTGQIPTGLPKGTFGEVSMLAKELPKPQGTLVDINTGVKPSKLNETQLGGISALYDIANKTKELKELDEKRWSGIVAGTFGKIFGSDDQQRYIDLRTEIVDLLARARTGAAITANEERIYASQLPGRFAEPAFLGADTQVRLDNFEKKINDSLKSKLSLNGLAIHGYSPIKIGGIEYKVGDIIENSKGQRGKINPDGSITLY